MISEKEKNIIISCAKKYNIPLIYLFGSAVESKEYNDIDLAVGGIRPEFFFKFYAELLRNLKKPVDLVDLSDNTLFTQIIQKKGVKIFG